MTIRTALAHRAGPTEQSLLWPKRGEISA